MAEEKAPKQSITAKVKALLSKLKLKSKSADGKKGQPVEEAKAQVAEVKKDVTEIVNDVKEQIEEKAAPTEGLHGDKTTL